jgi:hypothetical protein
MTRAKTGPFTLVSDGDRLVGVLHLPDEQPAAAVVTTGPLARRFCESVAMDTSELWIDSHSQIVGAHPPSLL